MEVTGGQVLRVLLVDQVLASTTVVDGGLKLEEVQTETAEHGTV